MERWSSVSNKRAFSYECKCGYEWYSKEAQRSLKKALRDMKEGRAYIWCCGTKRGRCVKSGKKLTICADCHMESCENWYRIGKRDMLKKLKDKAI
jgi:hypothetical protein